MTEAILIRREDPSGVSGTGPVAEIFEADDGAVAIRWRGDRPSWGLWSDIRDLEAIHGHEGKSVVEYLEPHRLLAAYQLVVPYLRSDDWVTCGPHPDHPDRLRVTFAEEPTWLFWIALFDGSSFAATHEEITGEMHHTWISPDGDLWLQYFTPLAGEGPLETYDREDR